MAENAVTREEFDLVAKNIVAAQEAIKESADKSEARVKELETKAEALVKDALKAQEPLNRARVLGEIAADYSGEYDSPFERAMHDRGPHARMLKGQPLSATEQKIARFQEVCDMILLGAQACGVGLEIAPDGETQDPDTIRRNEARLKNSLEQSKRGKKLWKEFDALRTELRATTTMDTTTEVAPWIPTLYSPQLINRYTLALKVASLFDAVDMPSTTYRLPVMFARESMANSMPAEPTGALTAFSSISSTGLYCTLAAKKSHKMTVFSDESDWDSIIPLMPMLQADHADWHAYCVEQALLNGDTTATHRDTGTGLSSTDTDFRCAWIGLRFLALGATTCSADMSAIANAGATAGSYGVLNMRYLRGKMGVYGTNPKDCAIVMGPANFIRILNDALLLTLDKLGPNATLKTGELGEVDGMPLIVSECYPSLTTSAGIYAGAANDYYSALMLNHRQFFIGNRLGFQSGFADLSVVYGCKAIASWKRTAFVPKQALSTANSFAYVGYKFSPTA